MHTADQRSFLVFFPLQRSKQIDNRFLTSFLAFFVALCRGTVKGFLICLTSYYLKPYFFGRAASLASDIRLCDATILGTANS